MTALLALTSPELCAAALGQPTPTSPEDAVRVIGAGSTAMRLDVVCAPWDHEAEQAAVQTMFGSSRDAEDSFVEWADQVTGWLVATPDRRPVVGVVSGPLWLSMTARRDDREFDAQDALDEAADFVAGRVRTLCQLGVDEVVVLERGCAAGIEPGVPAEAHTGITRLGRHFGVPIVLVGLDDAVPAEDLGYERWVSPGRGARGLVFVSAGSLRGGDALPFAGAERLVTEYLDADVSPDAVRALAGAVAGSEPGS